MTSILIGVFLSVSLVYLVVFVIQHFNPIDSVVVQRRLYFLPQFWISGKRSLIQLLGIILLKACLNRKR